MSNEFGRVSVNYASAHYNRRKSDGKFEIVARAEVDGVERFIAIAVVGNRVRAVEVVRDYRSGALKGPLSE